MADVIFILDLGGSSLSLAFTLANVDSRSGLGAAVVVASRLLGLSSDIFSSDNFLSEGIVEGNKKLSIRSDMLVSNGLLGWQSLKGESNVLDSESKCCLEN